MGRYYSGDIEGKFWFAVQSSDAPRRFGGQESEPNYIDYYFDEDTLSEVKKEIKKIKHNLRGKLGLIDKFFKTEGMYTDTGLKKYLEKNGQKVRDIKTILSDYADLVLGKKIKKCLEEQGDCSFMAEL